MLLEAVKVSPPDNTLLVVLALITPCLVILVGFFARMTLARMVTDIQELKKSALTITELQTQFKSFTKDLETALIAARQVDILKERLGIVSRDQKTMWTHIDAIRDETQQFGAVIAEFRAHLQIRKIENGKTS